MSSAPHDYSCDTCGLAAPYKGWDSCLACGVASCLQEQPDYLAFARRVYVSEPEWLSGLEREWNRQLSALAYVARACA